MKLFYYKRVSPYEVAAAIKKRMELTVYQQEKLADVIESLPFVIICFDRDEKKPVPWYRLTLPFYFIAATLLVIYMPVKWIFTGKGYYERYSPFMEFMSTWYKKISI